MYNVFISLSLSCSLVISRGIVRIVSLCSTYFTQIHDFNYYKERPSAPYSHITNPPNKRLPKLYDVAHLIVWSVYTIWKVQLRY